MITYLGLPKARASFVQEEKKQLEYAAGLIRGDVLQQRAEGKLPEGIRQIAMRCHIEALFEMVHIAALHWKTQQFLGHHDAMAAMKQDDLQGIRKNVDKGSSRWLLSTDCTSSCC